MKLGFNQQEYVINLSSPNFPGTAANWSLSPATLSAANHYVAGLFIPLYDMQVNRVAICAPAGANGTSTLTIGMTTVQTSDGNPNGSGGALTFINSGTTSSLVASEYNQITIADTTLSAGTQYFIAAQITTLTSNMSLTYVVANGSYFGNLDFPYHVVQSSPLINKGLGGHTLMCGYNNGTYTQWYGTPCSAPRQTIALNTSGTTTSAVGCKFMIPIDFTYINVDAVVLNGAKRNDHKLTVQIMESDRTTQVTNATSIIDTTWTTDEVSPAQLIFPFGTNVILKPYTTYYIKVTASGTANASGNNTLLNYEIVNGTLSTSNTAYAEFMNAFDTVNNLYSLSTSDVYTEYVNARLHASLACTFMGHSFRGAKENSYVGF